MIWLHTTDRIGLRLRGNLLPLSIDRHDLHIMMHCEIRHQTLLSDNHWGLRVLQHQGNSLGWKIWIERDISTTSFMNAQQTTNTDSAGNLRYYEPDFVVVDTDGGHHVVETKGMEDINVAHKDNAAHLWCENATALTGKPWAYRKVRQTEYESLQPTLLADLIALSS